MAEGFKGTVDWVGYPVGRSTAADAGFIGLLDFTGIPVGTEGGAPEAPAVAYMVGFGLNVQRPWI